MKKPWADKPCCRFQAQNLEIKCKYQNDFKQTWGVRRCDDQRPTLDAEIPSVQHLSLDFEINACMLHVNVMQMPYDNMRHADHDGQAR